jgi:FKBP-type peptidyl-prolyl cis-trans isomerase FkpA
MTEITRVPLQPISKGSLAKIWIGVAVVALFAAGIAYAAMPLSVDVDTVEAGEGPSPTREDVALINYKGTLPDGKVFDQAEQAVLPLDGVVPGFTKALEQMQKGGKYKVVIPSELAYGDTPPPGSPIPANADLTFEIELIDFKSRAEIEQQQRIMQQLQQMQGMPGMPGIPGPGPDGEPSE